MSDQTITSLIEKLEGAEAGSRELDLDVAQALNMKLWGRRHPSNNSHQWMTEMAGSSVPVPRFTTSLDAALALAERVLPGWYWRAGRTPLGQWHHGRYTYGWAHLSRTDASNCDRGDEATGWAATPALALCAAILLAQSEAR